MKGQWTGEFTGTNEGTLVVNIDKVDGHFEGVAFIQPNNNDLPSSVAHFETKDLENKQEVKAYINPVNPATGFEGNWDDVKEKYSGDVSHS
ncbi:MAG: hypothetical protein RPS47_00715, partial [Colwellia sp.]